QRKPVTACPQLPLPVRSWALKRFVSAMADDQERDLQRFLENVDEITSLIQEMNSDDPFIQQKAVLDSEKKLLLMEREQEEDGCRTTLNKTMISPPQTPEVSLSAMENADEMSPDAFLASVEKDAKERAKRRRENRVLADALKEKGNEAFVRGDYETAIFFYSEGLGKLKDMKVLYTNRAQAFIKLGDYQKALVDCDWALKCDENCTKAYFHMGKAHVALKNYSKAKECYQKIEEINPKLKAQVKEHLNQVTLREKADLQEKEAQESLDSGKNTAVTTKNLLETLSKPGQTPLFYAGGIEILTEMMADCTERTLFRTYGGFSTISDHEVIRRCLFLTGKDAVEEVLCVSVLKLWQEVCVDNEENQRLLVTHPDMARLLPSFMTSRILVIQQQSLDLLLQLTQTENGRNQVIKHLDMTQLCEALLSFLAFSDKKANTAIGILTDLALEERFQVWFQTNLPDVLPALTGALNREPKITSPSALCQCIALLGNISAEPTARKHMIAHEEFGNACLDLLVKCEEDMDLFREITYTLLGLIMNLCLEITFLSEMWVVKMSRKCLSLLNSKDGGILTRGKVEAAESAVLKNSAGLGRWHRGAESTGWSPLQGSCLSHAATFLLSDSENGCRR
ncbi:tetratricopeptide repeat domain 12, isoform CRA_a, partial [Mus musculus]